MTTEKKLTSTPMRQRHPFAIGEDAGRPLWAIYLTGDTTTTWEQMQTNMMDGTQLRPQTRRRDHQFEQSEVQIQ